MSTLYKLGQPDASKRLYHPTGTVDWLARIVKTVVVYTKGDAVYVRSIAAKRAEELYHKKNSY